MDLEKRVELISQVGEEIITMDELRELLQAKRNPIAYDGFEPSGKIHIAQGLLRAININKMTRAGCRFKMLVADWHAWANNKMGGSLENIQTVGKYMIETWKACGMDLDKVEFIWASDLVKNEDYWKTVMQVSRHATLKRILRTVQIMGRKESEVLQASQIIYPCMQTADIFHLRADICQLGMDQRKVNMLARELGPKLGYWKPVVISHHMLMGLETPTSSEKNKIERAIDLKMSKSKPDSAIFMTDSPKEVERKIIKAYCPERQVNENPVLEYCRYIVFEHGPLEVKRPQKFGGDTTFETYKELEKAYADGTLHPLDLKKAVAKRLNELLDPVRRHFEKNRNAKSILEAVSKLEVTR